MSTTAPLNPALPAGLAPTRTRLDNGIVVLAKQSTVTPAVTIQLAFTGGGAADPAGLPGLAAFVAKTIDRGTASPAGTRTADQIADILEERGVSLSAGVSRHVLTLTTTVLREDLETMLGVIADVARHPSFPPDEVETRRREIVTTIRQDDDSPMVVAHHAFLAMLFGADHPYGRPVRGTVESISRITRDDLLAYHRAHVTPAVMSLVLVGDVDAARATEVAVRVFGDWTSAVGPSAGAAHEAPVVPPVITPASRQRRVVPMMNKAQADIAYGFPGIAINDPDYAACLLMNNVLGEYAIGGRLGDSIRERQGMAYYVSSNLDANLAPGPLVIRAGVNPGNVDRALASIDEELTRFIADGPTEQEVRESRQYLIGSMPRNLETNEGIAGFLQAIELFGLGTDYDVRIPALLNAVTRDQVHAAARRLLDPARATVVVAGPYAGAIL